MNFIPPAKHLNGALLTLALSIFSATALYAEENNAGAASTVTDTAPQTQEAAAVTAGQRTATLSDYRSISERPLFHASRRPRPEAVTDKDFGELSEKWRLSGIILRKINPIALFSSKEQGGAPRRIEAGMPLEQRWLLDEVGPDYALVSNGEEQVRFELWQPRELTRPDSQQKTQQKTQQQSQQQKQPEVSKSDRKKLKPQIVEKAVDQTTD